MQKTVVEHGADLGDALDGDADRVLLSDEKGQLIDGDQLMGMITEYWSKKGLLRGGGLVSTVMSNLGLEKFIESLGLSLIRTQVGDRYVVEHMRSNGYNLGGEQSGHLVMTDYATTGDGLVAALQVLAAILDSGKPASEACRVFEPYPQILENVVFNGESPLDNDEVKAKIAEGENLLAATGRLLIRKSGTEPKIRVMAEGQDQDLVGSVVKDIVSVIESVART